MCAAIKGLFWLQGKSEPMRPKAPQLAVREENYHFRDIWELFFY
jgi:hypothetical protein